ncbi:coiled-coil domain-containing protein 42 homolog isoform X1 [Oryzias latipes]|uniref:coiled-coil domain-containing protein 42 homolog isoform X1 n=1 Tax=Oryzias latipes TaxID=8090 RepID=UPI0002A48058|nr:coiled-coil domain-containing protein 42 homolog isoform X1 [Oryzias latipes]
MTSLQPTIDSDEETERGKGINNIFVTQSADTREVTEEDGNCPVASETSRAVLQAGVTTLKKNMVIRKKAELDEMDVQLALKRHEFKRCMGALATRRSELETKQQQTQERMEKFEKFVGENEVKRCKALQKCEATREQNFLKQREIEDLAEQLKQLRTRKQVLKEKMQKYKIYEDYLMKTLNFLPRVHHDDGYESLVMPIIRRHKTLSITHQELQQRLSQMDTEAEEKKQKLQQMKEEHRTQKLMANKELSELQSELVTLEEKNKQTEANLMIKEGVVKEKVEEGARLLMAIDNLAQQCYLPTYGLLESMNVLFKMDMIKEYILDKADTERRVKKLRDSGTTLRSGASTADKGSFRSIENKSKMKNASTVSQKSAA